MANSSLSKFFHQLKPIMKSTVKHSVVFAKFLSLLHVTDTYIISPTLVYGPSMLPTLNFTGDVLLVEKISPLLGHVSTGDVVVVRSPDNPKKMITKRVIGVGGDTVSFSVNPGSDFDNDVTVVVPKGFIWIQGDNVYASNDSRHFGPVTCGLVIGRVFCRVWPLTDIARF